MRTSSLAGLRPFLLSLFLLGAAGNDPAVAQRGGMLLISVSSAETGEPLRGAQIVVQGVGIGGISDSSGRLILDNLPLGTRTVQARYLGYTTDEIVVSVEEGRAATAAFVLGLQPIELAAVKVRPRRSLLHNRGFYERRASGFGTFITREELDDMRPRFLSDVLRRTAGFHLSSTGMGGRSRANIRGAKVLGGCPIQYYVDGTLTAFFNIDEVQPSDVEALEIYRGAATIPPAFNKGTALCGVIVIWTRID